MVRQHKKAIGDHRLFKYSESSLQRAVASYKCQKGTLRSIAAKYWVPKSTLERKVKDLKPGEFGGQTVVTKEEENILVKALLKCAEWGFPLRPQDSANLVKSYLDRRGRSTVFTDNRPGRDWMTRFLGRHEELTKRLSENIKRCRAAVTSEIISDYFDHLTESLNNIPPENILNGDKTNFVDDPQNEKVLVRRGCHHPERVMDHSKTATSVMFTVSGTGELLPVYVVYKAQHLYPTWVEGGPKNAVYNRSNSGWFEMAHFEDYFEKVVIPYYNKTGGKAYICDGLAAHVSSVVIELCEANGISFILLPPNATNICQPLDVAVFRGLKLSWRAVLRSWKMQNRGVVPKAEFPALLKSAIEQSSPNLPENIRSGFRSCGIVPLNRDAVLNKLPRRCSDQSNRDSDAETSWGSAIEEH